MENKQIYASLEVNDHEVQLIVGEFFNTRFNIIKSVTIPCQGLGANGVRDEQDIIESIKLAVRQAEGSIGTDIEKVIFAIPSINVKRYSLKSTVEVTGINGTVTIEDIRDAIKKAENIQIDKNYALIQTVNIKYTVNGISSRRMPLDERANELTVDIDLLCCDRTVAFELVGCVEKAGLQIMDIFLDTFAISKEAVLFERAINQNVIVLKIEREFTTLGLLSKGRLNTCITYPGGIGTFAGAVVDQYGIKNDVAVELVKYSSSVDKSGQLDNPVYIWADDADTKQISKNDLNNCVKPAVMRWVNGIEQLCSSILQAGSTAVIITGEGGEMQCLDVLLSERLGCEVQRYIPETLGARNASLTTCLGLFFSYNDKLPLTGYTDSSIDMDRFLESVSYRDKDTKEEEKEDTITSKLKGILFEGRN